MRFCKNGPGVFIHPADGVGLRWSSTVADWISSSRSPEEEEESVHAVQVHPLNYAGVIFGKDLRYAPVEEVLCISGSD